MEAIIYIFIFIIGIISYQGIRDAAFQEKYLFHVDRILVNKEYYRILSSGFLHGDWFHLAFNMIALSSFGPYGLLEFGYAGFAIIYFGSLVGGNLLALYVHRHHGDYKALGASGAIFGVVFSSIVADPFSEISFILIPYGIPSWLIGIIFVAVSIWGIKKGFGNIGHEAHLGGAITGMIATAVLNPTILSENLWIYCLLGIPSIAFVLYIVNNPTFLLTEKISVNPPMQIRHNRKTEINEEEQLNILLDKIGDQGIDSLSEKEKSRLKELSTK